MRKNQNGFSVIEVLIVLVVLGLIGVAGWYVRNLNSNTVNPKTEINNANNSNVKDGWKQVSKNGVTISYPKAWDATEEEYQRLQVDGKAGDDSIYLGFGAPYGYTYVGNGSWQYVDSDGKKVDDTKPKSAPANVMGADSTILVSGGDGGCGGSAIGFAYKGNVYRVGLPWECDEAVHGSAGISGAVVAKDLEEVIRSIRVN
jgi:prepilin-type N-terminal cleavage/methylation domain-containing protein